MREEWKVVKENAYLGGQEDAEDNAADLQVLGVYIFDPLPLLLSLPYLKYMLLFEMSSMSLYPHQPGS